MTRPKTLWIHATHTTSAKVWLTPITNPRINTTHATHAISQTRKTNVTRNNNGLTTAKLHHWYSLWTYSRFWELVLDGDFSTEKKYFQSWQYSEKYCRNLCQFDVFIIISRHTVWLEDSEIVAPIESKEKVFFFLPGFCFTNIHESQDCKERGRAFH